MEVRQGDAGEETREAPRATSERLATWAAWVNPVFVNGFSRHKDQLRLVCILTRYSLRGRPGPRLIGGCNGRETFLTGEGKGAGGRETSGAPFEAAKQNCKYQVTQAKKLSEHTYSRVFGSRSFLLMQSYPLRPGKLWTFRDNFFIVIVTAAVFIRDIFAIVNISRIVVFRKVDDWVIQVW